MVSSDREVPAPLPIGDSIQTVAVIGTGTMGRGIAQVCAAAGVVTLLYDEAKDIAGKARDTIAVSLQGLVAKKRMDSAAAGRATALLRPIGCLKDVAAADLVIEAAVEDLAVKRELFRQLEDVVAASTLLASNTSSLSITAIAATCRNPERTAGFHFFNPPPLMRLVEVIGGLNTHMHTIEVLCAFAKRIGKVPIVVRDSPGFLVNHAGRALMPEALRIVAEAIAAPAQIDALVRETGGFRMGPFELLDLVGADIAHAVMEAIFEQYYFDPRYQPSALLAARVAGGVLGRKTGRGFYQYDVDGARRNEPQAASQGDTAADAAIFWIADRETELAQRLYRFLASKHLQVSEARKCPAEAIPCVAPLGEDCTTASARLGLDPKATVAFDMLVEAPARVTIMGSAFTSPQTLARVECVLASAKVPFSTIKDSPGFVLQRLLSMIVNIGTRIAELGIAKPEDIDVAAELGLNYPHGPFALGDLLGPRRVLGVLDAVFAQTHDPKYAATLWLRRRALLDYPLATPS